MLGRAAYQNPWLLSDVDAELFGAQANERTREDVLDELVDYAERHVANDGRLNNVTRHILGLYHGRPGARAFRRYLSENAVGASAGGDVLRHVASEMRALAARQMARERAVAHE
jgi:tRNA-dihydrouridine synthase A